MTRLRIAGLGSVAAAATAATWLAVAPGGSGPAAPQPGPDPGDQPAGAEYTDELIVCVGPDAVLRAPLPGGDCQVGQRKLKLAASHEPSCEGCYPWDEGPKPPPPTDRLGALQQRVNALEKSPLFTVVDRRGKPVLSVAPGLVRMYNGQGTAVAAIGATPEGGFFTGRSATQSAEVSIGASGTRVGVRVIENGISRFDLGGVDGQYALRIPSLRGDVAGIGTSRTGAGALIVGDRSGRLRASFTAPENSGLVGISRGSGLTVATLGPAATGGGMLVLGTDQADWAVKMGNNYERYGVVLAGPQLGMPLVYWSGLPGSYFLGCAGGELCGAQ